MEIIFFIIFALVVVVFISALAEKIMTLHHNTNSPRLTVDATVAAKHTSTAQHRHMNAGDPSGASGYHTAFSTTYYVTFQVESGDRMVFTVSSYDYSMLVEGDTGKLTFQGTRYMEFVRD